MGLIKSFYYSFQGLMYILRTQHNARIHLLMAVLVLLLGLLLGVSDIGLSALFFAVVIVFLAEIINTAFEKTLDLIDTNHHPEIKVIKDMAAGAVLIAAVAATLIGLVVLGPPLKALLWHQ